MPGGSDLSPRDSCYLYYDREGGSVWLSNDAGDAWFGPATLGSPARLQNSQCTVDAGHSSDLGAGETLMLNLSVSFLAGTGLKNKQV